MKLIILLLFSLTQSVLSQEPSCFFFEHTQYGYSCSLQIENPNGFDNFTHIGGSHLDGRSDLDVTYVISDFFAQSTIFPSIVCQQFPNTRVIRLDFFELERISDEAFRSCRSLIELQLFANPVMEISENAFVENRNLQELALISTMLETLPRNVFANQHSLLLLFLSQNLFETLPDGIFDSLQSLQQLYLTNNQLSALPTEIFKNLINLERISINGNQLTTLNPSWLENSPKLFFINLFNNQITTLPPNMFSALENLRVLLLDHNNLTTIHSNSFGLLPSLFQIDIISNQINSIDERFIDNTGIRTILTGGNPCDTTSGYISDDTESRELIRAAWQQCFDNFEENECEVGDLDERICTLEEEVRELRELIRELIK